MGSSFLVKFFNFSDLTSVFVTGTRIFHFRTVMLELSAVPGAEEGGVARAGLDDKPQQVPGPGHQLPVNHIPQLKMCHFIQFSAFCV